MKQNEVVVDVSAVVPRERHPRIFSAWASLADGAVMVVVNDHDPVPLYYQFAAEYRGGFHWEYLERGPESWRVRISKGRYADPGFVTGERVPAKQETPSTAAPQPLVLDIRPTFAQGESPCSAIDEAVASLAPGQSFVLLTPFEPAPLFGKLGAKGFSHRSEPVAGGSWRIEFTPGATPITGDAAAQASCSCH